MCVYAHILEASLLYCYNNCTCAYIGMLFHLNGSLYFFPLSLSLTMCVHLGVSQLARLRRLRLRWLDGWMAGDVHACMPCVSLYSRPNLEQYRHTDRGSWKVFSSPCMAASCNTGLTTYLRLDCFKLFSCCCCCCCCCYDDIIYPFCLRLCGQLEGFAFRETEWARTIQPPFSRV